MMTVNVCGGLFSCDFTANRHSLNKDGEFCATLGRWCSSERNLKQRYYPDQNDNLGRSEWNNPIQPV